MGNGPFVLTEWIPGQRLAARSNPHYWRAADVRLKEIHFFTIASGEVEERSFRAGQLHVTYTLPNSKIPVWRERTERGFRNERQLAVYYYGFNVSYPPFNDVRVRGSGSRHVRVSPSAAEARSRR